MKHPPYRDPRKHCGVDLRIHERATWDPATDEKVVATVVRPNFNVDPPALSGLAVTGGVVVDSGKFDWSASDKFPSLSQPEPAYHGLVFHPTLGGMAFTFLAALGYGVGGVQRVHNWKTRGIPPRVKLERPDLFLKAHVASTTDGSAAATQA